MDREKLIGTWELVSFEHRRKNGEIFHRYGKNHTGLILYNSDGYMSAQIMNPDRPQFTSGRQRGGTPEEIKAAFEGYWSYCGTYKVDEKEHTVFHNSEFGLFPNEVGKIKKRFIEFFGDQLSLTSESMEVNGETVVGIVTWKRLKPLKA